MDRSKAEMPKVQPLRLRDALREARLDNERTGVVIDIRDADLARLEILNDALEPVFQEVPRSVDIFDRAVSRGDHPRLWIDMIAFVAIETDRRVYRFVQNTRYGPRIIAESATVDDIVREVTRYIARRIIERERALVADEPGPRLRPLVRARRRRWLRTFLFGLVVGVAGVFAAAWFAAGL